MLRQACRSLGEAHSAGLLHRDIKPQNLFLCRLGIDFDIVKVLDFGLVKSLDESATSLTAAGTLTGTPVLYAARARAGPTADERSDLYSLGCVAYWMLTGQPLFAGEPMAVMIHHARTKPKPPSAILGAGIPERLEQVVLACLEKVPGEAALVGHRSVAAAGRRAADGRLDAAASPALVARSSAGPFDGAGPRRWQRRTERPAALIRRAPQSPQSEPKFSHIEDFCVRSYRAGPKVAVSAPGLEWYVGC